VRQGEKQPVGRSTGRTRLKLRSPRKHDVLKLRTSPTVLTPASGRVVRSADQRIDRRGCRRIANHLAQRFRPPKHEVVVVLKRGINHGDYRWRPRRNQPHGQILGWATGGTGERVGPVFCSPPCIAQGKTALRGGGVGGVHSRLGGRSPSRAKGRGACRSSARDPLVAALPAAWALRANGVSDQPGDFAGPRRAFACGQPGGRIGAVTGIGRHGIPNKLARLFV